MSARRDFRAPALPVPVGVDVNHTGDNDDDGDDDSDLDLESQALWTQLVISRNLAEASQDDDDSAENQVTDEEEEEEEDFINGNDDAVEPVDDGLLDDCPEDVVEEEPEDPEDEEHVEPFPLALRRTLDEANEELAHRQQQEYQQQQEQLQQQQQQQQLQFMYGGSGFPMQQQQQHQSQQQMAALTAAPPLYWQPPWMMTPPLNWYATPHMLPQGAPAAWAPPAAVGPVATPNPGHSSSGQPSHSAVPLPVGDVPLVSVETTSLLSSTPQQAQSANTVIRIPICKHFVLGRCKFARTCRKAHAFFPIDMRHLVTIPGITVEVVVPIQLEGTGVTGAASDNVAASAFVKESHNDEDPRADEPQDDPLDEPQDEQPAASVSPLRASSTPPCMRI
jgi:hypothetical protein